MKAANQINHIIHIYHSLITAINMQNANSFVLASEYHFTVPSDIMARFIRKHISMLMYGFSAFRFLGLILISHLCVIQQPIHYRSCLFYNQVAFGWGKTIMASLWLNIFWPHFDIPLWVAQHLATCIVSNLPLFTAKLCFWRCRYSPCETLVLYGFHHVLWQQISLVRTLLHNQGIYCLDLWSCKVTVLVKWRMQAF